MGQQGGSKAALTTQQREGIQGLACLGALPTGLLEESQSQVAPHDHLGVRRRRFLDQVHTLH